MSEIDEMTQMTRLEVEIGEKALKYSIDTTKFMYSTLKKLAMFFAGLKYARNKGLTNMDNLVRKTGGNTQLVQIPDELQNDFEEFCKKHGILASKLYDLNLKDGKKQYAIDANMGDMVFNQFAVSAVEKYKANSQAGAYKARLEIVGMELREEYRRLDEVKMLLERMRHGMPENETDALAEALGYKDVSDEAFLDYMEEKYGEFTMEACIKEAEEHYAKTSDRTDWKEKEFTNVQGKYEAELSRIKNPVTAISWEDYINSNKCSLDGFEEITKRMAHGKDEGNYEKVNAAAAFEKNTIDIPRTAADYSYCPDKPDIVIKRRYSPEHDKESGRIEGCSHVLECEADGKKLSFDDSGLYGAAYKEGLENFLKEAGLSMEDEFVTIEDDREFEKYRSVDKEIKKKEKEAEERKKKYDDSVSFQELSERMKDSVKGKDLAFNKTTAEKSEAGEKSMEEKSEASGKSPLEEELDKRHNASVEKYKSERERRLKNRDYVYTIQNPKQDVFFVKGDEGIIRVNTPLNDGRGNGFCIMEFDKKDIISNPNGSYSVYFNENDMFKMYSYDEINNDGTLIASASPRTIMADYLKSSTYTAINFKERQDKQDGMGMEFKNDTRMRKQV